MTAHADLFAVCNAAFETPGAICLANEFPCLGAVRDLIVYFGSRQTAGFRACANRNRFHCGYRHHGLREQSVELEVPGSVRTQSRHGAARDDFEDATQRIAFLTRFVDELDHSLLHL